MSPAVERSLVSDQVFRILCEQILSGGYEPGEKLPTQRTLAAELGVNMASIREAVKRLEQLRLVDVRHGDAMRVRDWRAHGGLDVVAHVLFRAGGLDRDTLAALLEARRLMLQEAARLAAERRTDDQAERLRELAQRIAASEDAEEAQSLDWAFMNELVEASGNVVFVLIMNSIRELYFGGAELFEDIGGAELAPLYRRAADAVAAGAAGRAAGAVAKLAAAQEAAPGGSAAMRLAALSAARGVDLRVPVRHGRRSRAGAPAGARHHRGGLLRHLARSLAAPQPDGAEGPALRGGALAPGVRPAEPPAPARCGWAGAGAGRRRGRDASLRPGSS